MRNSNSSIPTIRSAKKIEHQSMETTRHRICIYHVILIGLGQEFNLHLLLQFNSEPPTRKNYTLTRIYCENNYLRIIFVIFEGFCTLKISGKERKFHRITREIRNFWKIIISEQFYISNNLVSEGKLVCHHFN